MTTFGRALEAGGSYYGHWEQRTRLEFDDQGLSSSFFFFHKSYFGEIFHLIFSNFIDRCGIERNSQVSRSKDLMMILSPAEDFCLKPEFSKRECGINRKNRYSE